MRSKLKASYYYLCHAQNVPRLFDVRETSIKDYYNERLNYAIPNERYTSWMLNQYVLAPVLNVKMKWNILYRLSWEEYVSSYT